MKMFKFFLVAIVCCTIKMAESSEKFTSAFDLLSVSDILGNHNTMVDFCKCLLGETRCEPRCEAVKLWIKDALLTNCKHCTEKQKEKAMKIIKYLYLNETKWWKKLEKKFDPEQKFKRRFLSEMMHAK